MQQIRSGSRRLWKRRALSLLLAAVMVLGLVPGFPGAGSEASAHWADPYLSQLVEWGFIRTDQANNPDRALTRADFMGIVNRAYGYATPGETPFEDVKETDWFYDDVGIAYTARYMKGTSPTTASPNDPLTRETATTILGRNMMLQESPGEILDFTDARSISNWAMGTVKSSLEHYLVSGYDDGTFRPKRNVSWGEMAALVTRLIGTPLQEKGDYYLGGVFGNVTITSPGVTLRDTVISGDLYITGGVGLGGVKLENVTVLGRIIASGTGQSESGGASILLRNVTADELLVDNLQDNFVTLRADGVTEIGRTTVRTSAYIEDNTPDGMGLKYISLEGETYPEGEEPDDWEPILLQLAGRIEEVVNRTPGSTVQAAKGTVAKLTVDEAATDSKVIIDRGAVVKELNLDTATTVTGEGDIEHLVVNAPGCEVEMLPDKIDIRPGVTAIIAGEEMDTIAAEESSMEPLILAGYPKAQDVTPTGLEAVFMTNKSGTIYWAVSAITDGSVGEEDLIKPPSYGSIAVRNSSLKSPKGNEEVMTAISGLTPGGSYYLSAVLVDARGQRSPVKVIAFTTPDNTVPAFCDGYPHMSSVGTGRNPTPEDLERPGISQAVVMPTKDCKLYYALLPQNAVPPTQDELKTASVAGALGYGVMDVYKNAETVFQVHDQTLEEKTTYVLYLWLVDANGVNKSPIVPLTFTTDDETPPEFIVDPTPGTPQATSVPLTFRLNENGTVYWVAVPSNSNIPYPKPQPGTDDETAPLSSKWAILQVASGMNLGAGCKAGSVNAVENVDGTITVTGLQPETSYDFYYVAKDNAGPDRNYSVTVKKIVIHTEDSTGPKFTQSFSNVTDVTNNTVNPRADTDIWLDVTEDIMYDGAGGNVAFTELYKAVKEAQDAHDAAKEKAAKDKLAQNIYETIKLYKRTGTNWVLIDGATETHSTDKAFDKTTMVLDYTAVTVESRGSGGIRITFPKEGLALENGSDYCFVISKVADTSDKRNGLAPLEAVDFRTPTGESNGRQQNHNVPIFSVEPATLLLYEPGNGLQGGRPLVSKTVNGTASTAEVDEGQILFFRMDPKSTDTASPTLSYDLLLWSDSRVTFDLYYRIVDSAGNPKPATENAKTYSETTDKSKMLYYQGNKDNTRKPDANGWIKLNYGSNSAPKGVYPANGHWAATSLNRYFNECPAAGFPKLTSLDSTLGYEFVIVLQTRDGNPDYTAWTDPINFRITAAAGQTGYLHELGGKLVQRPNENEEIWKTFKENADGKGGKSIGETTIPGNPMPDTLPLSWPLELRLPKLSTNPVFKPTSNSVTMSFDLDVPGKVSFVIAKATSNGGDPAITFTRKTLSSERTADPTLGETVKVTMNGPNPPPDSGTGIPDWMKGFTATATTAEPDGSTVDDPQADNLIQSPPSPTRFEVQQQKLRPDNNDMVFPGSVDCNTDGILPGQITVDGLDPDEDYFVYFVIEKASGGEPSHTYIYHFKTNEAMKPKIRLVPDQESGNMSRSIKSEFATSGNYLMFREDEALVGNVSIMMKPFNEWADPDKTLPTDYQKDSFTVLDALTTEYSWSVAGGGSTANKDAYFPSLIGNNGQPDYGPYNEGYSVFDIYANEQARSQIYTLATSGRLITPEVVQPTVVTVPSGEVSTTKPAASEVNTWRGGSPALPVGKDLGRYSYIFLTAAVNTTQAGANTATDVNAYKKASFHASVYQKGKRSGPELINTYGSYIDWDSDMDTYSGLIVLNFRDAVYHYLDPGKEDFTASNLLGPGVTVMPKKDSFVPGDISRQALQLSFEGLKTGTVIFPADYFCNATYESATETLLIQLHDDVQSNGTHNRFLRVQWGVGDPNNPGADRIWDIPVTVASSDYAVLLKGGKLDKYGGSASITFDAPTGDSGNITAEMDQPGLSNQEFTWTIESGADVISLADASGAVSGDGTQFVGTTAKVVPKAAGVATVKVVGTGKTSGGTYKNAKEATLQVTVRAGTLTITPAAPTTSAQVTWNPDPPTANSSLTLTKFPAASGSTQPDASFTVCTYDLGVSAEISVDARTELRNTSADDYISCTTNNNKVTITAKDYTSRPDQPPDKVTLTIRVKTKVGDTTLSDNSLIITVTVNGSDTGLSIVGIRPF